MIGSGLADAADSHSAAIASADISADFVSAAEAAVEQQPAPCGVLGSDRVAVNRWRNL